MNRFKLNFDIPESPGKINIKDGIYLIGSCFSDEMAQKLSGFKFKTLTNPFGTLYNPISIFNVLRGEIGPDHITYNQGVFYHWDCHGEVSALNEGALKNDISRRINESKEFLAQTNWLIITLGTAFIYRLKKSEEIVANCHKSPSSDFTKELLTVDQIVDGFRETYNKLSNNTQVLFTVSPVRHIKDGLVENNLSKSILIQAVNQIANSFERVSYFPSYEIVLDELRDYRFYKKDRIHPNEEAVDYIWSRLMEILMDGETTQFIKSWGTIRSALNHRPFHPTSPTHQKFLKETIRKLDQFKDIVDISEEQHILEQQLS